jgi:hypothetical protein
MNRENRRYFFSVFLFLTLNKILHEIAARLGALHDYRGADGPHQHSYDVHFWGKSGHKC